MTKFEKNDFEKLPFISENPFTNLDYPEIKRISSEGDLPMYNVFPNENSLKFNNIDKWPKKNSRFKREQLLSPQEVEVFKITSLKHPQKVDENREVVKKREASTDWDLLGLMSSIRKSFFDNFFESNDGKHLILYLLVTDSKEVPGKK